MTDNVILSEESSKDVPVNKTVEVAAEVSKEEVAPVSEEASKEKIVTSGFFSEDDKKVAVKILKQVLLSKDPNVLGDYTVEQILNTEAMLKIEKMESQLKKLLSLSTKQFISQKEALVSEFNVKLDSIPGVLELRAEYQGKIQDRQYQYNQSVQLALSGHEQNVLNVVRDVSAFKLLPNISMNSWLADHAFIITDLSKQISSLDKPEAEQAINAETVAKSKEEALSAGQGDASTEVVADKPVEDSTADLGQDSDATIASAPVETDNQVVEGVVSMDANLAVDQGVVGETLSDSGH